MTRARVGRAEGSGLLARLLVCAALGGVFAAPLQVGAKERRDRDEARRDRRPKKISKRDRRRAKELFSRGYQKFVELDYKGALELFQESFDLSGNPGLLLYIGLCHQKLGNYPEAVRHLEDFLDLVPNAPEEERIRARGEIEDMQRRLEQEERARQRAEERAAEERLEKDLRTEDPPRDDEPLWKSWKLWTGVGVVAVAAGATATFFILRDDGIPASDLGNIPLGIRF